MKITCFYYISYPNCSPRDPLIAESEVYVEVSESEDGSIDNFDWLYKLNICTVGFLEIALKSRPFHCKRSLIVVSRFDDPTITEALEALLPNIDEFADRE